MKGRRRTRHSSFYRQADWAAARANLKYLHDMTSTLRQRPLLLDDREISDYVADLHETVHHLAVNLGAVDDWLHRDDRT